MSARASKRLLAALDTDEAPSSDTRPSEFERLTIVSADMVATVREVFAGTALLENETMVRAVVETRHEIEHAWGRAKHSFITIGRALNRLDAMMRTKSERAALKWVSSACFRCRSPSRASSGASLTLLIPADSPKAYVLRVTRLLINSPC